MSDLIEQLLKNPREFDFFQAVALIEKYQSDESPSLLQNGKVKFSPTIGLGFPSSDINAVDTNSVPVQFLLSFMGLLGVSSPLPHYFTEYGLRFSDEKSAFADFLNMFDHRLYSLFYLAWKKYRINSGQTKKGGLDIHKIAVCLCGEDPDSSKDAANDFTVQNERLFSSVPKSADGLTLFLTDTLPGVKVTVEQWVPRWARIDNLRKLGIDMILGSEAMLGETVYDLNGKIRITLELEDRQKLNAFLPGSRNISDVQNVLKRFLPWHMLYDIVVVFTPDTLYPVVLGSGNAALGISASCGEATKNSESYSITIPGRN